MALCGHAILGDATYEWNKRPSTNNNDKNYDNNARLATTERSTSQRMCLHAHRLTIPLMMEDGGGSVEEKTFTAPDPFRWKRQRCSNDDEDDVVDDNLNNLNDDSNANTLEIII